MIPSFDNCPVCASTVTGFICERDPIAPMPLFEAGKPIEYPTRIFATPCGHRVNVDCEVTGMIVRAVLTAYEEPEWRKRLTENAD
jgi:hypothetical protein